MEKIRVIGRIALTAEQRQRLKRLGTEYIANTDPDSRSDFDEILKRVDHATVILNNLSSPLPRNVLEKCPCIKFIQTWSTGTDNIDLEYAKSMGIRVANVPDYSTEAIAEKTICAMLLAANDLIAANRHAIEGNWDYHFFTGTELKGRTLLTIGSGKTATRLSELARAFGMNVLQFDSETPKESLNHLISRSTFITVNCPLNDGTYHLLGKKQFDEMHGVILINYARGGIVDEQAMLYALKTGKLKFAAIDVFENEPPAKENPLLNHPKVFVTPHCAWNTTESMVKLTDRAIDNIEHYIEGRLIDFIV